MEFVTVSFARARRGTWLRLAALLAACLSCTALVDAATIGTSSYLQVNLSFMPFTYYDYNHLAASYGFTTNGIASCPSGASVRSCFQTILVQLQQQGVTGIRIFVTFCDSGSLAFTTSSGASACGLPYTQVSWNPSATGTVGQQLQQTWITNVANFFLDVNAAHILNVTLTTGASAGDVSTLPIDSTSSPLGPCSSGVCCPDTPSTVYFNPMIPFGMTSNTYPIGDYYNSHNNQGYNCAPINTTFIGWSNYLNVINALLAKAKGFVTVYELEIQEEVNVQIATALMRYFYDNSLPQSAPSQYVSTIGKYTYANILTALRAQMTANGFDPGRVEYSAAWTDSSSATENCANEYEDYARNWGLDAIAQTINGGTIGVPAGSTGLDGLTCGGTITSFMFTSPIYSSPPDVVDVHIYPSVTGTANTGAMIQQVAALDYGDIPHFLAEANQESAEIVIGETYGGALDPAEVGGYYCWATAANSQTGFAGYPLPSGTPTDNVDGFNNEGVSSPLSSYTVTFRPWMELEDPSGACFPYGTGPDTSGNYQTVNYGNEGPYTPTNP